MPIRCTLFLAAVALAFSQPPPGAPKFRIEGIVQEVSGIPVADAQVFVDGNKERPNRNAPLAQTAQDGTFSIQLDEPGSYLVSIRVQGYMQVSNTAGIVNLRTADKPAKVTITLYRAAAVSGRIVDAETLEPVRGIEVAATAAPYESGRRVLSRPGNAVLTSEDGAFRLTGLRPGNDYVLELFARDEKAVVRDGWDPPDDPAITGYGFQFWPEAASLEHLAPFTIASGADLRLPDIRLSKRRLYRIRGTMLAPDCREGQREGQRYSLYVLQDRGPHSTFSAAQSELHCKSRFTIAALWPGDYHVRATEVSPAAAERPSSHQDLTLAAGDAELAVEPAPPVAIWGTVQYPKDFPESARRNLAPEVTALRAGAYSPRIQHARDLAKFGILVYSSRTYQFQLTGLPPPYFVSETLLNGSRIIDGVFDPPPASPTNSLTVVISDQSAAVHGKVTLRDEPGPASIVILVPWPVRRKNDFPIHSMAKTDSEGRYSLRSLPPQRYRLFAVPASAPGNLQRPGTLETLAGAAREVNLEAGADLDVALQLVGHE
jgi:hypothetical protein